MNNEAILNKLIELGYAKTRTEAIYLNYFDADGFEQSGELFAPENCAADFELLQRALFDECAKKGLYINIIRNHIIIEDLWGVEAHRGDTSRASFIQAFCKVTGINL